MSSDGAGGGQSLLVKILATVTPDPIRRRYAIKFGLALVVMAALIGGIGWFATDRISAEVKDNVEDDYRNAASQEASIVEQWIQQNRISTRLLSQNTVWSKEEGLEIALRREAAGLGPAIVGAHLVDIRNGEAVVAASTSLDSGKNLSETSRSWIGEQRRDLQKLQTDDVYLQPTYEVGSRNVVAFVSPTGVSEGRYLVLEAPVSRVQEDLQGRTRAEGGFTQVVGTETNLVLIDELGRDTLSLYADGGTALAPIRRGSSIRGTDTGAGVIVRMDANSQVINETYTVGYAPVEGTDWVVVTHAPRSSVFGFVQTVSNFGLGATVAAVLLIGLFGTVLGKSTASAIDRLTAKTEKMREGDLDVQLQTTRIDNIGRLYDGFAEMRDALRTQINEAEQARKEAEVSRAEAEEITIYLQEKAEEYSETMQECATGDLTQRLSQDGESESMDRIATEFNDMIEELEKTVGQLKSYVDEVEEAGAKVERSADAVREASEQVADSIQTIAVDAENQRERLYDISESINALADELDALAAEHDEVVIDDSLDGLRTVADDIEEAISLSEETRSETDTVSAAAEEQAAELNEVSERAGDLQRYAQPLRDILQRFDTEAEHEFVFSVGPTGGRAPLSRSADEEEE